MQNHIDRAGRCVLLALLLFTLTPTTASAYILESVTVQPPSPIPLGEPVALDTLTIAPSGPAFLYQPTSVSIIGNDILVELYVDSGPLTVITPFPHTVDLGPLPAGEYQYTVNLIPLNDIPSTQDMRQKTGSFTVVPEPASSMLLVAGLACLARRRTR